MKKLLPTVFFLTISKLILAPTAWAMCPLCTVAVTAGLGLSRFLGIDDTVSGLWIGGMIVSTAYWFSEWLKKKYKINIYYQNGFVLFLSYALVFIPLYFTGIVGHPLNTVWGIDKLIFGTALGSVIFFLASALSDFIKKKRGRILFSYQKIVIPVLALTITSVILYLTVK